VTATLKDVLKAINFPLQLYHCYCNSQNNGYSGTRCLEWRQREL